MIAIYVSKCSLMRGSKGGSPASSGVPLAYHLRLTRL